MKHIEFAIKLALAILIGMFMTSLVEREGWATGMGAGVLAWILVDSWWRGIDK